MTNVLPVAFLCSVYTDLKALRQRVGDWSDRSGLPVWIAERDCDLKLPDHSTDQEYADASLKIANSCMAAVRSAKVVICVLGGYGSLEFPFRSASVSVLELEMFQAALHLKPVYVLQLPHAKPDPRCASLLEMLSHVHPWICPPERCDSVDAAFERIKEIITAEGRGPSRSRPDLPHEFSSALCRLLAEHAKPAIDPASHPSIRFLDGQFLGVTTGPIEKDVVVRLIQFARTCENEADRLAYLWVAMRHLAAVPYEEGKNVEYLPLWEEALRRWASAAAWYGAHGFLKLGRLAAVTSLREIHGMRPSGGRAPSTSIHASLGALASEYYSMAGLASSPSERRRLLREALRYAQEALSTEPTDKSGVLLIKGSIELRLGMRLAAVRSFRSALKDREAASEDPGRIGEAETHLGFAKLMCWFVPWYLLHALRLLQTGVQRLRSHRRDGFLVTAQKKLGICRLALLDLHGARREFNEALTLAYERSYFDQVIQLDRLLVALANVKGRPALALWLLKHGKRIRTKAGP